MPFNWRTFILAGSIKDDTTLLQLYECNVSQDHEHGHRAPGTLVAEKIFRHSDYDVERASSESIAHMIQDFMGLEAVAHRAPGGLSAIGVSCLAISGPVDSRDVSWTNRAHVKVDATELQTLLKLDKVMLVNDFLASGYGLLTLGRQDVVTLQDAPVVEGAPIACIGAEEGGLGECYLTCHDGEYRAWPSEGGHCEFAPKTDLQVELLQYLKSRHKESHRVSVERVVSGNGLVAVYDFLCEMYQHMIDKRIHREIQKAADKAMAISYYANIDRLCYKAMEILVWTYGSEAGCAALKWLPYGGLYIAGAIAPQNLQRLRSDTTFIDAYYDKGRVNPLMRQVPVKVVVATDLVVRGAHLLAFRTLKQHRTRHRRKKGVLLPRFTTLSLLCVASLLVFGMTFKLVKKR